MNEDPPEGTDELPPNGDGPAPTHPTTTDEDTATDPADQPPGPPAELDSQTPSAPMKVCPSCSAAERTSGAFCPHCGTSYDRATSQPTRRRPSKRALLVSLAVFVVVGGGAGAAVVKHNHDVQVADDKREAAARAEAEAEAAKRDAAEKAAARVAETAREEKATKDRLLRSIRATLIVDLRKAITKDARKRVNEGILDGPIYGTQCDPVGGGNASNLDARTGKYDCMAISKKNDDGTIEGYRFSSTVNFKEFSYTWHLGS